MILRFALCVVVFASSLHEVDVQKNKNVVDDIAISPLMASLFHNFIPSGLRSSHKKQQLVRWLHLCTHNYC